MTSTGIDILSYSLEGAQRRSFHALGVDLARQFDAVTRNGTVPVDSVPAGLRAFLRNFSANPPRGGVALVRGIEIDALPPTPQTRADQSPIGHNTSGNLLLAADMLGSMTGYADEKNGALVHEVHPVRGEESRIENTGSVNFGFHTENAHHPLRPDFLGLLCLRQDHDRIGVTRVSSIRDAVTDLSPTTIDVLRAARFRSLYPTSFVRGDSGERPSSAPHPVVTGEAPDYFLRFDLDNTYALDEQAKAALAELNSALDRNRQEVLLEPGDLAVINNHIAAHGRSGFTPRYDGHDRWLRRFYSLRATPDWVRGSMPMPRVLPPLSQIDASHPASN
ncbi:MAG TPA: TauD/TfdA family dioxygenase [Sporichthyaceae bacterium]|nr:TauD/TfdA family dioxygenase [Sporichthyaceae bacterium]